MHNAFTLRRIQRVGDLDGQRKQPLRFELAAPTRCASLSALFMLDGDRGTGMPNLFPTTIGGSTGWT